MTSSVLFVTWVLLAGNVATGNVTTGNVAPVPCQAGNFTAGEDATITCIFSQNIEESKHHLYITKYPLYSDTSYRDVIVCTRELSRHLNCRGKDGYKVMPVVGTNFTIDIPGVTTRFTGRYICSLVPADIPQDSCYLYVQGNANGQTKESSTSKTDGDKSSPCVIALAVICPLAVVFLVCLVWTKRRSIRIFLCERGGQCDGLRMIAAKVHYTVPQSEPGQEEDEETVPGSSSGDEEARLLSPAINSGAWQHRSTDERSKTGRETKTPSGTYGPGD